LPPQLVQMLPYIMVVLLLTFISVRDKYRGKAA